MAKNKDVTVLRVTVDNQSGRILSTEAEHPETGEGIAVDVEWETLIGLEPGTIQALFEELEAARQAAQQPQPPAQGQPMVLVFGGGAQPGPTAPPPAAAPHVRAAPDSPGVRAPIHSGVRAPIPEAARTGPPWVRQEASSGRTGLPWVREEASSGRTGLPWVREEAVSRTGPPWVRVSETPPEAAPGVRLGEAPGVLDDSGNEE